LERRPRLPPRLRRADVTRRLEVAPAHQRADFARYGIERDQAAFEIARRLASLRNLRHARGDRLFGGALHPGVVAGVDTQAALQHLLSAEPRDQLATDFFL